jgi:16S rRNA (uracil1498-N3)-methyltransferase
MQSRALRLPVIEEVQPVGSVAGGLAHFDGEPLSLLDPCVLIGPEGGWSDDELAGRRHVSLGPRVLRAETAAVSAGVLLSALRDQGSIAP